MFAVFTTLVGAGIAQGAARKSEKAQLKAAVEMSRERTAQTRQLLIGGAAFAALCVGIVLVKRGRKG